MSKLLLKAAFISAIALATTAQAEVLTFNSTAGTAMPGATWVAEDTYTFFEGASVYQGYQFISPLQWYAGYTNAVIYCGGSSTNCAHNGSDSLLTSPTLKVQRADGGAFSLQGFDLDNGRDISVTEAQASFSVTGFKADGTTVHTTVTLDALPNGDTFGTPQAFNHFDFTGFSDLRSFEINRITPNEWNYLALDNLQVAAVTPVPEPASWLMFGLGLAGLGAYAKRRKA